MPYDPDLATNHLRAADPIMAGIIDRVGPFAMSADTPDPFRSLARAIIFQQLSGAAAGTIYRRFLALFSAWEAGDATLLARSSPAWEPVEEPFPLPEALLAVSDEHYRGAGLSRQKSSYLRDLATHFATCESCPASLYDAPDEEVIAHLTAIRGVGRWTVEMFLIFHLRRPDVLPVNDVGINRAIMRAYALPGLPGPAEIAAIGAPWRPFASVACWYLWRSEDTVVMA